MYHYLLLFCFLLTNPGGSRLHVSTDKSLYRSVEDNVRIKIYNPEPEKVLYALRLQVLKDTTWVTQASWMRGWTWDHTHMGKIETVRTGDTASYQLEAGTLLADQKTIRGRHRFRIEVFDVEPGDYFIFPLPGQSGFSPARAEFEVKGK